MMMMMSISPSSLQSQLTTMKSQTNQVNFEKSQATKGQTSLGKDSFMRLMLAQLQGQNPLEPVDSTQQLAQQAQFTQVEELQKLNATLNKNSQGSDASLYSGKQIEYKDSSGQIKTGLVDSISFGKDSLGLNVNGKVVTPAQVTKLYATNPSTTTGS
jgi:flagellar basal-body rod modification protein FlgD